ncbi:nuclear protein 96-domain-containing protein [Lasiosphaeris hirsuta]|uniref:Nuclear protein 96-domain-containing protein n=1 Tax=Lasiosphaeris hirsuta TaxID=260670 RepID=A0AA40A170_9PEZI|nr:nuclear protein 96-domain-containing protein [Lasiosphaeris hirsuta]
MSFGGTGGFGGFGQTNNQQQSTGFGGFGASNTNTGFGSTATPAFGATNNTTTPAGGGLFGSTAGTSFGATGGGFGSTASTTTTGGGLFGSTTATAPSTGFGGGFGAANTTGSTSFGAKPVTATGFGNTTTGFGGTSTGAGGSIFGGGATSGFGASNNPGIGTNVGDPPGTAVVPFTATVEKEANNPSQSNSYQNILFLDAYKKWSSEELRLTDYNQGRKQGSPGGTGAFGGSGFGTTSGFGATTQTNTGFGANTSSGGLFGSSQPATGGFGAAATTNTGGAFGSGGGGLFGAKPATTTGGLFGSTTAQPAQSGGLFGSGTSGFGAATNTQPSGFGAATNTATGGGLFGGTAAAKPAGFSFGNTASTGTGFGNTGAAQTGFGANTGATNTGGGLFGNTAQPAAGGGLFGGAQPQQPAASGFGGAGFGAQAQNTGGGLFGSQPKPGGLFGSATTNTGATAGLFGGQPATQTGFGATNTAQPAAGGLFGAKTAATGGGLFGSSMAAQAGTTSGGLFGNLQSSTQAQPQQQSSLFGGMNQNNQQKTSLFGQQPAGGGLFGGQPAQQQGGGLFGSTNNQQQAQGGGFGNSLLGTSQNNQAQPQSFSTTIDSMSAYGSATLFSGLPSEQLQNPGPLATPLSSKTKNKSRSILPMYRLSPANAPRYSTPQRKGFGFSYSTYGSPSSPSSVASTPGGLGQSLLLNSVNRGLSKSISASNLRRSFNVEDSILQPGAFSASSSARLHGNNGGHKKLVINRDMRSDLFTAPNKETLTPEAANGSRKLAKRVSFDTSTTATPESGSQETTRESQASGSNVFEDASYPKQNGRSNGNGANGSKTPTTSTPPDMEQAKGNELAIVHEEESPAPVRTAKKNDAAIDSGSYWMSPSKEEINMLNRKQREKVPNFTVGREKVGSVSFKVPVDLSTINVDELCDNIVVLIPRSATVYPNPGTKPPLHSYPRGGLRTSGSRLAKHISKLESMQDTTFLSYEKETGVWTFQVEHFTTYGLSEDEDEDETDADITLGGYSSKETTTQLPSLSAHKEDVASPEIDPDDTFDFKRSRRAVPGAFDEAALEDALSDAEEAPGAVQSQAIRSPQPQDLDAPMQTREWSEDESMEGTQDDYQYEVFQQSSPHSSAEEQDEVALARYAENEVQVPAGILRARMRAVKKSTAPTRIEVAGGNDWTQILQASVKVPRTVDRATLRALNESGAAWDMKDRGSPVPQNRHVSDGAGFATSIDLMKSLFEQAKGPTQPAQASPAKGFVKWPYQKRSQHDDEETSPVSRPNWGPNELLVTTHNGETNLLPVESNTITHNALSHRTLSQLEQYIGSTPPFDSRQGTPSPDLRDLAQGEPMWELASLLFGDEGINLPAFWKQLVAGATNHALTQALTPEEKVIICLAGGRVPDACGHLLAARDFRLANLVACIGTQSKDIRTQLKDWRESNVLSEFSEPVRAIYELLAGNAGVCDGVKNVPLEHRVTSFTISQRFGLDWMQSFGLRLFYTTTRPAGSGADVTEAVRSYQSDIEQDKEAEPDDALWSLLKVYAFREFDWSDPRLGWLLTKAVYSTGRVSFGQDATEKLDRDSVSFASILTAQSHWVPATFVLIQISEPSSRVAAVRDHLGRHAHLIGSQQDPNSPFVALRNMGVPETWIWEARALDLRSKQDSCQEFLALVWAENYTEANHVFVNRVGPNLVIERDFARLFSFAELLFKVKKALPDWDRAAIVYLLYPMARWQGGNGSKQRQGLDRLDNQLFDGLVSLRTATHGDIRQEAAIADMAEELIKWRGGDNRLYQLLPEDVRGRYMRSHALDNIR